MTTNKIEIAWRMFWKVSVLEQAVLSRASSELWKLVRQQQASVFQELASEEGSRSL